MDCPVCKYPNAAGATHCGMCYEVFNRSAADAYMQAVKRDREPARDSTPAPAGPGMADEAMGRLAEAVKKIDWPRLQASAISLFMRWRWIFAGAAAVVAGWIIISGLVSPTFWYRSIGDKLSYAFPTGKSPVFMVGMSQKIRSWSERGGRLDTPLEDYQVEELGNVYFVSEKSAARKPNTVRLKVQEWIQILHDTNNQTSTGIPLSHSIPLNHPSLAEARIVLNKKNGIAERRTSANARVGKVTPFLIPLFPAKHVHRGQTWTEHVEWTDIFNDWKIHWAGTLVWTAGNLQACSEGNCVRLTYRADVRPQLWASPSWAAKAVRSAEAQISTDGVALFDPSHGRMTSNTFSYDGMLRIPIKDLGRIPEELRVGRRVHKVPGDIVIRFENKIDLHKN